MAKGWSDEKRRKRLAILHQIIKDSVKDSKEYAKKRAK